MANNTTLPGTGDIIASEDLGGVKYQQMKLIDPTPGSSAPIGVDGNPIVVSDGKSQGLLRVIINLLMAPLGYDKSLQRQRGTVVVETLPTLTNVTTVANVTTTGTLTNQTNIGGFNADAQVRAMINTAWNLNVRARIT